ncbi:serine/arginine repetitive matrix protein 2-like isoform X2 [Macrobrachium nipponense]|uniref:serine/arginine repetitive matrix protein 2-like isoform X2 n=1 Tax=Macrobrachium nipponense TaxID=159736 RepID=UPI0030C8CB4B
MDTSSVDFFWSEVKQGTSARRIGHCSLSPSVRAASWADESRDFHSPHDTTPSLDLDALKLALTHLDHSLQKGKAFVGRSGALSNRRPPSRESRSSRRSSADSLQLLQDQADLEEDLVIPRVVNIEVQVESQSKESKSREQKSGEKTFNSAQNRDFTFREQLQESKLYKTNEKRKGLDSFSANQEIRKKLFETRNRRTLGGSNPLLSSTHESEESFRRIKEEVARLAAKRRSSSDISELWPPSDVTSNSSVTDSQRSEAARRWNEERESLLESASTIFEREGEENRSSSEADFVISDRESIADSGLVNRRTVIKISEKKSKSATNLISENPVPLWIRDLQTRRSLRSGKDQSTTRVIPIEVDPSFEGGINVSIVNQPEPPRKESTSRMYVRQSDSENRPSRASAFNVRRTIEKRQIQQERRERKALREQIKEQLRSLSEERERRDSSSSHVSSTHISQNSVRSKSMSSLDQDQDDFRSESPLFKVQSSPTLEKEKEGIRSYLFGASNLTESGPPSHDMSPTSREVNITKEDISDVENFCESLNTEPDNHTESERSSVRDRIKSCDPLETENTKNTRSLFINRSIDSFQGTSIYNQQHPNPVSSLHQIPTEESLRSPVRHEREKLTDTPTKFKSDISDISNIEDTEQQILVETESTDRDSFSLQKEEDQPETRPIPPPRKHRLSLSAGHITLEGEEKPNWIRLAKERRSLRTAKPVDQLSDRASSTCQEPEWVAKARRKLEALNVTLTSTTDFNSVSSHITESSSAWSRGGLDALDDLREETSRIGVELAEEASARVNEDLSVSKGTNKMLEHNTDRSRDQSAERPRVSFDSSAVETSEGDSNRRYRSRKPQKDEVRFGDLKHDWGGVQSKSSKAATGKTKETRFGEIPTKDSGCESPPEKSKETRFGDHFKGSPVQKSHSNPTSPSGNLPVMRFGDTPLNLFPDSQAKKVQSSSKFESVAGPDPTKMTAEQLNQNVEEYDFPIPTGKEDVTEFMRFLEESLKKAEIVPEVVCTEDPKPKPKSILKRRSVENVFLELKKEEKNEFHQKVEHRKSASFDWDTVDEQASPPSTPPIPVVAPTETSKNGVNEGVSNQNEFTSTLGQLRDEESQGKKKQAKVFSFTFNPEQKITSKTTFTCLEEDTLLQQKTQKEVENKRRTEGVKTFMIITNPNSVSKTHEVKEVPELNSHSNNATKPQHFPEKMRSKTHPKTEVQSESPSNYATKTPEANVISSWKRLVTQNLSSSNEERKKSYETNSEPSPKQKVHQVKLEVVDDEQKKHSPSKREEERRRSSLLEWEAMQRQRLEDEEKNRINKNLSIKPVSAKIKELVKIHGSFMSMFSKDKKTDINGTVDGKDDIVFRKMSSDNTSTHANGQHLQGNPLPMKSPYIVKKLLMPSKAYISEESKTHKYTSKDMSKPPSSGHRTSHVSHNSSKSRSVRDRSESPMKMHTRDRSQVPAKHHSTRDRSPSPSKTRISGEQSPSLSKVIKTRSPSPIKRSTGERSPSPAKRHTSRARSPSPAKLHSSRRRSPSPAKFRTSRGRSPSPANFRTSRRSPSPANIRTSRRSPSPANIRTSRRSPSPANFRTSRRSPSPADIRTSMGRSPASSKIYSAHERHSSPSKILKTRERSPSPTGGHTSKPTSSPHKIRTVRDRSQSPLKAQSPSKFDLSAGTFIAKERLQVPKDDNDPLDEKTREEKNNFTEDTANSPEPAVQRPLRSNFKMKKEIGTCQPSTIFPPPSKDENMNGNDGLSLKKDVNFTAKAQIPFDRISPPVPPKRYYKETLNNSSAHTDLFDKIDSQEDKEVPLVDDKSDISPYEFRKSEYRSSIKDPKNRKEWLNKMLNTISSDNVSPQSKEHFPSPSVNQKLRVQNSLKQEPTSFLSDKDKTLAKDDKTQVLLENSFSDIGSSEPCHANVSATSLECLPGAKFRYKRTSRNLLESSNLIDTDPSISDNQLYLSRKEMSPPSTPKSLGSSFGDLYDSSQAKNSRRGPVSLSSIIGDSSSRSSSLTSTPFTSPRATPERVIRKDSLDMIAKLGVIPESRLRESTQLSPSVEEHKENIAPLSIPGSNREDTESYSYQPSSRQSPWYTEKQQDIRDENKDRSSEHDNGSSQNIHSPGAKPYSFGKPSVTMKSLLGTAGLQKKSNNWSSQIFCDESKEDVPQLKSAYNHKDSYLSNSYPRDNKDPISARFSKERVSLKARLVPEISENISQSSRYQNVNEYKTGSPKTKMKALSERFSPERKEDTVSLASILTRSEAPKYSISEETFNSRFESKSPFTKESDDIQNYHEDAAHSRYLDNDIHSPRCVQSTLLVSESDDLSERNSVSTRGDHSRASSLDPASKESSPVREPSRVARKQSAKGKVTSAKKTNDVPGTSAPPRGLTRRNSNSGKQRTRVVRRNSSLKRSRPDDPKAVSLYKKERKTSESDSADIKSETVVQDDAGWTKTKTTVRRARLGSSEKARQILRTNSGKTRKEKTFKADASKALEEWAAGTNVEGKLMKKEGQKFSHETEEEVKGGQRTTRGVTRRIIRRGSRRLSSGGELLMETKETSSEGTSKDKKKSGSPEDDPSTQQSEALAIDDGLSRKMKASTDGERYVTQSVSNKDGKQTFTTEGVNNKTTNSVEVIGGDDFEAKREVQGKTGYRVLVERSKDNLGRPSTVVRKVTSQSRVVITKTKRKTPVVV